MSKTNDTELIAIVKTIPKAKQRGRKNEVYDMLYEAIMKTEKGTKGKLNINESKCGNIRSGLISRRKKDERGDYKPFLLYTRNPIRKDKKLVSAELYFERISIEEWNKREKAKEERKKSK